MKRLVLFLVLPATILLPVHLIAGPERFEKTIAAYEKKDKATPPPANPVLFVGSSTFRGWRNLEKDFAPLPAINRGFGGSTMRGVLHFFDRVVVPYKPKLIVVYEGDNDLVSAKWVALIKPILEEALAD